MFSEHNIVVTQQQMERGGGGGGGGGADRVISVNIMVADALAPCVARTSAAMILTM